MNADIDCGTLTHVDPETLGRLETAADNYVNGPDRLKAEILAAGRKGEKPAVIARGIRYAYTYDYVAKLIREDRDANPDAYAVAES